MRQSLQVLRESKRERESPPPLPPLSHPLLFLVSLLLALPVKAVSVSTRAAASLTLCHIWALRSRSVRPFVPLKPVPPSLSPSLPPSHSLPPSPSPFLSRAAERQSCWIWKKELTCGTKRSLASADFPLQSLVFWPSWTVLSLLFIGSNSLLTWCCCFHLSSFTGLSDGGLGVPPRRTFAPLTNQSRFSTDSNSLSNANFTNFNTFQLRETNYNCKLVPCPLVAGGSNRQWFENMVYLLFTIYTKGFIWESLHLNGRKIHISFSLMDHPSSKLVL